MRTPRLTMASMMIASALIALNFAFIRMVVRADWNGRLPVSTYAPAVLIGSLPLVNVLAIGLIAVVRQVARRGECGPFLFGALTTGIAVVLATGWVLVAHDDLVRGYIDGISGMMERLLMAVGRSWGSLGASFAVYAIEITCCVAAIAPWQLIPVWLGGRLNRRIGLVIARQKRREWIEGAGDDEVTPRQR